MLCTAFAGMNLTMSLIAIPTLLLPHPSSRPQPLRGSDGSQLLPASPSALLARQWQSIYYGGHRVGPAMAILGALAFALARQTSDAEPARSIFTAAAIASLGAVPYTLGLMLPTNNALHERANMASKADSKTMTGDHVASLKAEETIRLIVRWKRMNIGRASICLCAAVCGVVAMTL